MARQGGAAPKKVYDSTDIHKSEHYGNGSTCAMPGPRLTTKSSLVWTRKPWLLKLQSSTLPGLKSALSDKPQPATALLLENRILATER